MYNIDMACSRSFHRMFTAILLAGVLLIALLAVVDAGAQSDGQLRIAAAGRDGAAYVVRAGDRVTVPVEAVDVSGLGAASILLAFDPQVVQVTGCTLPAGKPFSGFCNPAYGPGLMRFNILAPQGLSATLETLVEVVFQALDNDDARQTALTLTADYIADQQGNALAVELVGGAIYVEAAPRTIDGQLVVGAQGENTWSLTPGESLAAPVTLRISETHPLAALTALVRYDPAIVRPTGCVLGDERLMGYCNPGFDRETGLIKFNLLSAGGVSGAMQALEVRFEAASGAWASASSQLTPILEHASDLAGDPLSWRLAGGQIVIGRGQANAAQVILGEPAGSGQYAVEQGSTATVSILAVDVVDLAAATFALTCDPAVVRPVGCQIEPAMAGGGACNWQGEEVRFSLVIPEGLTGTAALARADFAPLAGTPAGASSALSLVVEHFANRAGAAIPSLVRSGEIVVEEGQPGPALALLRADPVDGRSAFSLPLGSQVQVPIRVEGAAGLASASVEVHFDPAVVEAGDCLAAQAPFDGGFCNPDYGPGVARFNGLALRGISGTATLAELTFAPAAGVQPGAEDSETGLTIHVLNLDDASGQALAYALRPGRIAIVAAPAGPAAVRLRVGDGPLRLVEEGQGTLPLLASMDEGVAVGLLTAVLGYDPSLVRPVACTINRDPGANGFDGGGCNLVYGPGQVRLSALSAAGVAGETTVARITFESIDPAGGSSDLPLEVILLADPASQDLAYDVEAGSLLIPDEDGDSLADYVEFGAGPAGDGNGDGTADSLQARVTSLPNAVDGRYVTLVAGTGSRFGNVRALAGGSLPSLPGGFDLPLGLLAFDLHVAGAGAAGQATLIVPAELAGDLFLGYGATGWHDLAGTWQGRQIELALGDGGNGDGDLNRNGVIAVQGGPVYQHWRAVQGSASAAPNGGQPLAAGATVTAFDSGGVVCGTAPVLSQGRYGPLACLRDDAGTARDEGAEPGQTMTFSVDGYPAVAQGPDEAIWAVGLAALDVNLLACMLPGDFDCSGEVTVADVQRLAYRLATGQGEAGYYPPLDRNGDGEIDLADLARQATDW